MDQKTTRWMLALVAVHGIVIAFGARQRIQLAFEGIDPMYYLPSLAGVLRVGGGILFTLAFVFAIIMRFKRTGGEL
ncbi:hypothetical protein [Natronosalvus vescus]|uniref:hypothetical protein n=1 Tax=Natronosalvus vescus TaxID=2953881 RepID=UPI002090451F|nr:hypothetical protein [Natronosalvus vescus]